MFNLSISQELFRRVLPTSLKQPIISGSDDNHIPVLPELLDRIIDHLHDEKLALLALGLTSRQTLIRSRVHLFCKLEFVQPNTSFDALARARYDKQFDEFLALLDATWTTFTCAVESLHIKQLFYPSRGYKYRPKRNIPRIATNLPKLKTLSLTSMSWLHIPPHVRDFFFKLDIAHLQVDRIGFGVYQQNDFVELFSRLQPSVKTVTLYDLIFDDDIPDLSRDSLIFQRPIHLKSLDTCSLLLLKDVWDPLRTKQLNISVDSLHIRLNPMSDRNLEVHTPFLSRFLQHVGPSLHYLFVELSDPISGAYTPRLSDPIDLSQCVNVRVVHIGTITSGHISESGQLKMSRMLSMTWESLSTLPSHSSSLEEIVLLFGPAGVTPEESVADLESVAWRDFVGRLQKMFGSLTTVTIQVGYYAENEDPAPYPEAVRQAPGIRELEEKGIVSVEMVPWTPLEYPFPTPRWRESL